MGLIKAAAAALSGTMEDIWKEMFVCDSLPMEVLMVRGTKRISNRSANTGGDPNTITHGSILIVADGQCALVVSGGKVIDCCSEPGEYTFQDPSHTSGLGGLMKEAGQRISFGGDAPPRMNRVYYVNLKECMNNPFFTERPVTIASPGLEPMYGKVYCSGVFSYRIKDPALFYKLLAGNVAGSYTRLRLNSQITTELLKAMGPAMSSLSLTGLRPSEIPAHAGDLSREIQAASGKGWLGQRGIEIVSVAVSSITPAALYEVQGLQKLSVLTGGERPAGSGAHEAAGGARSMPGPADASEKSPGTAGPEPAAAPAAHSAASGKDPGRWTCVCGTGSTGNFCPECGRSRIWTCACGRENTGRFCTDCGAKRP